MKSQLVWKDLHQIIILVLFLNLWTISFGQSNSVSLSGSWGELAVSEVNLVPPESFFNTKKPPAQVKWVFPRMPVSDLEDKLLQTGLSSREVRKILGQVRVDLATNQLNVFPPADIMYQMNSLVRTRLYSWLGKYPANFAYVHPLRYPSENPLDWLKGSGLSDSIRSMILPLIHVSNGYSYFSDLLLVLGNVNERKERIKIQQAMNRTVNIKARLVLRESSNHRDIAKYWGLQDREEEVFNLIQKAKQNQDAHVEVTELLPGFARKYLGAYLDKAQIPDGESRDCHWATVGFFEGESKASGILSAESNRSFNMDNLENIVRPEKAGDMIIYMDPQGNILHSAVYIAADLVFNKMGRNSRSPIALQRLKDLNEMYLSKRGSSISFFRVKPGKS